jgi:L-asparaginase
LNVSNVAGVQISNVGSSDVSSSILVQIAHQINSFVCDDPTMAGAVVTHGTDTLEETAFFLDATVNCGKPVVIVGAMRPATAISADGPFNLLEAVTVATTPSARDRGAMVVMNDRIVSAYYVTKTNANTMDTFKAYEQGNLGTLISNTPYFFYPPVTPTGKAAYDIRNVTAIPRVDILMSYQDMSNDTLYNAVASGAKGIVVSYFYHIPLTSTNSPWIAGSGAGSTSFNFSLAMTDVIATSGIPIIDSTRVMSGEVSNTGFNEEEPSPISSGFLNPYKSRILLGILLAQMKNMTEIAAAFNSSATFVG